MNRVVFLVFLLFFSCTAIHKASYKIEETHYALYKQKVLLVHAIKAKKVLFTNPTNTRCYYLKGKQYMNKWAPGDTFVIENNLEYFYKLNYARECKP